VGALSSDAIGYGLTSSPAIRHELGRRGVELVVPHPDLGEPELASGHRRTTWTSRMYADAAERIYRRPPDLVFAFHNFSIFPTVIRKTLQDLSLDIPIVGYQHGSHWDPTDVYRFERYPGMELLDLANMYVMDRLFLVSEYMRATLADNIENVNADLAKLILDKSRVVGLPIDTDRLEACRTGEKFKRLTIVFNHAPDTGKQPGLFATTVADILAEYDVNVLFTRRFASGATGASEVAALSKRFGERILHGEDMALSDYYAALWRADIQVSTATHESLGIATLEAMYAHTCCVLPNLGSYPEICGEDPRVLYEPGPAGLASRLAYLIEHPPERREIAAQLSARAGGYRPGPVTDRIMAAVADL
jgi:glycosyltransferase involved in cell wall biosynthesis